MAVLVEYEQDIDLLESLYNQHKALLDQHHLDIDLRELAGYAWRCAPIRWTGLTIYRIMRDLDECLSSTNLDLGKKKLPGFKDLWRAGELREKMVGANTKIGSIRNRWQVWGSLVSTVNYTDDQLSRCVYKSVRSHRRRRSMAVKLK